MFARLFWLLLCLPLTAPAASFNLSRAHYQDRVEAVWLAQIIAVLVDWPFEHQVSSVRWVDKYPRLWTNAPVDDDWYYEMVAVRAFEKHGIGLTTRQLGEQWKENSCGSWGSSEQARLNLAKGLSAPDSGHPRYNKLWFTIGPQFSADLYGALAPGRPNLAATLARRFGQVNGYAEAVDGAVFMAGMVSLAFAEKDPQTIVRKAAQLVHPDSPYRQCLEMVISMASKGKTFREIADAVEDRWHIEYPATNNAVPNGGLVALAVWFGEGDFLKTINLAAQAGDFTDADCNAANAAAVVGALRGTAGLPKSLVSALNDRIVGEKMGQVNLTPAVDEKISELAKRTAAIGLKFLESEKVKMSDPLEIPLEDPKTLDLQRFVLADLMKFWNPDWKLERAGFGGAGGGMGGIRGITCLEGEVLATYPRDEVRGLVLRRKARLSEKPRLRFMAGVDPGRAWELQVYANNRLVEKRLIDGGAGGEERRWQTIEIPLGDLAGTEAELRLFQRVLLGRKTAGNAYWKDLKLE